MKRFVMLAVVAGALFVANTAHAQQKLGYVFVEAIIGNLPEFTGVQQSLKTHQEMLSKNLNIKQAYAQSKFEEYQQKKQAGKMAPGEEETAQKELQQLDGELRKYSDDAEQSMAKKREELLQPLYEKTQKAIDEVAKVEGYTYVLNGGNSTIVVAPPENNITEKVFTKLGIKLPEQPKAAATGAGAPANTKPVAPSTTPAKPAGAPK